METSTTESPNEFPGSTSESASGSTGDCASDVDSELEWPFWMEGGVLQLPSHAACWVQFVGPDAAAPHVTWLELYCEDYPDPPGTPTELAEEGPSNEGISHPTIRLPTELDASLLSRQTELTMRSHTSDISSAFIFTLRDSADNLVAAGIHSPTLPVIGAEDFFAPLSLALVDDPCATPRFLCRTGAVDARLDDVEKRRMFAPAIEVLEGADKAFGLVLEWACLPDEGESGAVRAFVLRVPT